MEWYGESPRYVSWFLEELIYGRGVGIVISLRLLVMSMLTLAYVISPVDALPESYGLLGLLDDLLIILLFTSFARSIWNDTHLAQIWSQWRRNRAGT